MSKASNPLCLELAKGSRISHAAISGRPKLMLAWPVNQLSYSSHTEQNAEGKSDQGHQ
jgi:hypothetical protein